MSDVVIQVENLSKYYCLGLIGGGTLREDVNRWWAKLRGQPDPLLRIGESDHGNRKDGQLWALRDINLQVKQGEILGIIGRNGAGKSTLLKILSRITAPTEGRVKIKGRVGSLLEVGTGFHPELTGRENIYLNGTILGMTRPEVTRKLDEIVEFAEMAQFIDTPVKRYSSGMTVRLAFAVAAHLEPEILIIDEVLAVGDVAFQRKCLGKMGEVASGGRTILFVSHNMESVQRLCTECALLSRGSVEQFGFVNDVVAAYLNTVARSGAGSFLREAAHTRQTAGRSTIFAVALRDQAGEKCTMFNVWEPIGVELLLQHPDNSHFTDGCVRAWICFHNAMGTPVLSYFEHDDRPPETDNPPPSTISARIAALDLPPGRYVLSCGLFLFDALGKREIIDWVENIGTFDVAMLMADGRVFDHRIGQVAARCGWKAAA